MYLFTEHKIICIYTMYVVVSFEEDETVGVVASDWLTPRKRHVHWPPYKSQKVFNRAAKELEEIKHDWTLHSISRCLYESGE